MNTHEENKAEGQKPKRCSITGNLCLTDTWNLDNPPDCHCGNLMRQVQDPLYDKIEALEWDIDDLQTELSDIENGSYDKSMVLDIFREIEREIWLMILNNSHKSLEDLQKLVLDRTRSLL